MKSTCLFSLLALLFLISSASAQQRCKLLAENEFEGILSDEQTRQINVLVIHGTGVKPDSYADNMTSYCFREAGACKVDTQNLYTSQDGLITVKKVTGQIGKDRTLAFYVLHWSNYTAAAKEMVHATERDRNVNRGLISKFLKNKVLIKEFYDFVVFSNTAFKAQIAMALDRAMDDVLKASAGKTSALNLVSGSLGSSIFIEYVNRLQYEQSLQEPALSKEAKENIGRKIDYITGNTCRFFMLTNQVNFLESIIAQKEQMLLMAKKENTMQIVAFRHTNDALSFYLPQNTASLFVDFMPVKVTNVRYKNMLRGNFLMQAHTRPMDLRKIHKALLFGSAYKKVKIKP